MTKKLLIKIMSLLIVFLVLFSFYCKIELEKELNRDLIIATFKKADHIGEKLAPRAYEVLEKSNIVMMRGDFFKQSVVFLIMFMIFIIMLLLIIFNNHEENMVNHRDTHTMILSRKKNE